MPALIPWTLSDSVVKFGLADPADDDFSCSVTSLVLTPEPIVRTTPATACSAEGDTIVGVKWSAELSGLADWHTVAGLQEFLWTNRLATCFVSISPRDDTATAPSVKFQVTQLPPPPLGGGADEPATFTVTMPVLGEPTPTFAPAPPDGGGA